MLGAEDVTAVFPEKPYVLYALIALNTLVYMVTSYSTGFLYSTTDWVARLGYIPALLLTRPLEGFLRIFTAMFTHANLAHIFFNMYFLYIFGRPVERSLGHWRFLGLYIVSGVLAAVFHTVFIYLQGPSGLVIPSVGASGAISGVLGAYMLLYPGTRLVACFFLLFIPWCFEMLAGYYILFWFALQVLEGYFTLYSTIAFFAHAGGFLAGIALLPVFADRARIMLLKRLSRARTLFGIITILYPYEGRRGLTPGTKAVFAGLVALLLAGTAAAYVYASMQPPVRMAAYRIGWSIEGAINGTDLAFVAFSSGRTHVIPFAVSTIPGQIVIEALDRYGLLYNPEFAGGRVTLTASQLPPVTLTVRPTLYTVRAFTVQPLKLTLTYNKEGYLADALADLLVGAALQPVKLSGAVRLLGLRDPLPLLRAMALVSTVTVLASLYVTLYRDEEYVITPE